MDALRQTLIEPAYLHPSLSRARLFALLIPQIHIFLIETFALDKQYKCHIFLIIEYILFQGFRTP